MNPTAIGTLPVYSLAPLEYRYALDAAMSVLGNRDEILVRCGDPALLGEVRNRIPEWREEGKANAGLWVEPQIEGWHEDLKVFHESVAPGSPLVVVASRPLAKMLEERRNGSWQAGSLGITPGGIRRINQALMRDGFEIESQYGIHTMRSIGINFLSRLSDSFGRPDLADRLGFAARLNYFTAGPSRALGTVALIFARRNP